MINQTQLLSISDVLNKSVPNEWFGADFKRSGFTEVELERKMVFEGRKFIIDQLITWLKSRLKQQPSMATDISYLLNWLEDIRYRGFYHICDVISRKKINFYAVAPVPNIKAYAEYKNGIIPILDFCTNQSIKANTAF
jgi:hypothetical protein